MDRDHCWRRRRAGVPTARAGKQNLRAVVFRWWFAVTVLALASPRLFAQGVEEQTDSSRMIPTARAVLRTSDIDIDGQLTEPAWSDAQVASGFVQREPLEGNPAEEQTEVRVVFDDAAVFVGVRMYDSSPDGIAKQLVRRDGFGQFDYFEVSFDPNRDRRTGYGFRVSAANVQRDQYMFDDSEDDEAWDAVWQSAVHLDSLGWSLEIRIPLSQMRYEASDAPQTWGVNFTRRRLQTNEESQFALVSRTQQGVVSQFGALEGVVIPRASRLAPTVCLHHQLRR